MLVKGLFVWMLCTTIATAQFVFQPENVTLTNLVIDNSTGYVYVGGLNYIFKLNKNLTQLKNVSTKCLEDSCVTSNTNQLLIIENLKGTPRLFACGTHNNNYGLCATYDINSLSYTVLEGTSGAVSSNTQYGSTALEDPANNGILIATTTLRNENVPKDYTFNNYESKRCRGTVPVKTCIGEKNFLLLANDRPKMYYILAVIVGKFRYFFSHNMDDGTNVARLCKSYDGPQEIQTYMEIPLQCVGKDGTNYTQLVAAKVVRPDGKLAEKFGSTGNDDDAVLIGVFQKSNTPSEAALCTYTFKEINAIFWKNIKKCASDNKVTLNKHLPDSKCKMELRPEECSTSSQNKKMTGTIKYESKALATCSDCGFISSMDTTSYQGNLIAFLGAKEGKLSKFIIYSNSSGRKYNSSNRISGSGISSVKFNRLGNSAYLLSQNKVLRIPVEECDNRKTCESCVVDGDPYCGWCTLKATCTTWDKCLYYGSPLGFVRYSNECISITNVTPPSLPLSETKIQKINISIVNLPVRQKNNAYGCSVNNIEMPSNLNGDKMECSVPTSVQLPEASSETGFVKAEIAVFSNETSAKIATAVLEFYNCSAISSCSKCTTGLLKCSWCHYEGECTANASTACPASFAPWVSNASQHQCPLLNKQTFYIPASVEREVTLRGKQFPKPASPNGEYQCTLTSGSQSYSIPATWNNSTSITCGAQQYNYSGSSIELSANISVKLGKTNMGDPIKVYLYQCRWTAKLCGSCVGSKAKVEYECGWCVNSSSCSVRDGCSSGQWVKPLGKCPNRPQIQSFFPKTGHVRGNSRLEINGTEFGRKYEDVEEVSIAGLQCKTIKKDYVIAKRIVCLTSNSSKSLSAKIKIKIAEKVGFSEKEFHYQNPQVEDYEPKKGPVSGGTKVTIFGKELNTGVDIQVFLGRSKCLDLRVTQKKMTCTTSQFKNVTRKRRSISNDENLVVTFDGLPPVYGPNITSFQYVPDPIITDITPRFTFPSSHRRINVTGSNLDGIHFPRIRITFEDKTNVQGDCDKPSFDNMMCRFPNLTRITAVRKGQFSLYLDGVTTWVDLSGYPKFNSITIVPDPVVFEFPDGIFVLKSTILEIKGENFKVEEKTELLKFMVTVGGEKCNITAVTKEVIYCEAPEHSSLPKQENYQVVVNVSSSNLHFIVGKVKYDIDVDGASSADMLVIYIVIGVGAGALIFLALIMFCYCRRKNRQQEQKERNYEMQMNSLESKVAKECREATAEITVTITKKCDNKLKGAALFWETPFFMENRHNPVIERKHHLLLQRQSPTTFAFAELQTDMTDFTSDLGDGSIHYFDFKNYAMRVLFPGVAHHEVMDEKLGKESPNWDEALRTFSQLIGNKNFLLIFVKTLENQSQFKMQDRCNVASLLVVALQSKMDYCTDILQHLLAELIRKSMSRSHPKLLLRRTECIAEKLLTNWLTFTLSNFVKDKAGKPLFMLYKAIRFQIEKGPVDVITNEARYSLSEDKLLRQSIEYNKLTVTVEFEDNLPVQVDVLDTDTIEQTKEKIMEVVFKNVPFSCRQPKDELILKWVESPSNHTILKDEDTTSLREGEWKRLNTLGHYQVPDGTCLRLVRRFASGFDTSEIHNASLPKVTYSPSVYSTSSLVQSSKHNISDAERKPWHLSKHVDSYVQEKDDPRHSKMLSEIYLTRLLSTKGTLQQYVDDMFNCIFPTFRKNERPPLPIKFLFDFLDDQARELNITDPEVLHTWKNNSLPLRFWVNLIKNPNFLFDVYKAPIVDSCLSVIAQLFMDSCSVSEHVLGKDSPSNKLLYAKEIPAYKNKVESFYRDVANAPRLTDEEIKDFFSAHYIEDFNVDSALKQLYQYAAKYQDELQEALEDARYPQLASKLEHVVAIFSDD